MLAGSLAFQDEFLPIIISTFCGGDSKNVSLKMQRLFLEQAIGEIVMKSTVALSNFPISASWLQRRSCLTSGMRKYRRLFRPIDLLFPEIDGKIKVH